MTISSTTRKTSPYVGDDSTDTFAFAFKVFAASEVYVVELDEDTELERVLTLTTDYSVSLNANQNTNPGGEITLVAPLAVGKKLVISSNVQPLQATDLTNGGGFYPQVITASLDKLTILVQQLIENLGRVLALPITAPSSVATALPFPSANSLIGWNEDANELQNIDPVSLATVVAFGTSVTDLFNGTGAQTVFTLSANPGTINNLDVAINGVVQRPGVDFTWSSGTTLTFTTAPPAGTNNVLARYMQALPSAYASANEIGLIDAGSYFTGGDVETALQEIGLRMNLITTQDMGAGSSGTVTIPAKAKAAIIYFCGGGGGGGGGSDQFPGGGGGSGNHAMFIVHGAIGGQVLTYATGSAGAAGAYGATAGSNGGQGTQTSITWSNGWQWVAGGGEGGIAGTATPTAGYASGQGGRGGNTAETGSAPAGVVHGQFNIGAGVGQSGSLRKHYGTWTPTLTFATPGDLSVTYGTRTGEYEIDGDMVRLSWDIRTTAFTFTTASGNMRVTGSPFTARNGGITRNLGPAAWDGIDKTNFSQINAYIDANSAIVELIASGMGQALSTVQASNCTTGTNVSVRGEVQFRVAAGSGGVGGWGCNQGDIGGGGRGGAPGNPGGSGTDAAQGGYIHMEFWG